MRADRLVAALLLLQTRGRVTAEALAAELEVSTRTARRDLEALAAAGVPVYAQPGRSGGWSLVGGARTDLSGLTSAEARALFLLAGPGAGLVPEARTALRKLVLALPQPFRADAQVAASAVVLDPARWNGAAPPPAPHLEVLQRAVVERRQVRLEYADRRRRESTRTVHPLGLVRKGAAWYLVAGDAEGVRRTFQLARIRAAAILDERADRPEGFDLAAEWATAVAAVEPRRRRVRALVRAPRYALGPLRERWGADLTVLSEREDDVLIELAAAMPEMIAEQLAGWGARIEVIGPDEVRALLARIGAELAGRYGQTTSSTMS